MRTSEIILQNLVLNYDYAKRVIPYLKEEYFDESGDQFFFRHTSHFINKYNASPTFDALFVEFTNDKSIPENTFNQIDTLVGKLKGRKESEHLDWLLQTTESFCKERALYNSIRQSIAIFEGDDKKHDWGAIPDILNQALAVSFDTSIGHDYLSDYEKRFEYYHRVEDRLAFDIDYLNKITKGGLPPKTLNLVYAGTHAGKSAMMCHMASHNLMAGKNVLYVTLEMSEEEVSKRIDANLFDLSFDQVMTLTKKDFTSKVNKLQEKTQGILKVKEYPTATAHIGHVRSLVNELRLKQGFEPDIIYIDYINIMTSSRVKAGSNGTTSYTLMKAISEELRGLAVELNLPIFSATQFNRSASTSSDPSMDGVAESFAVNFIADLVLGVVATDDLKERGAVLVKQLKNRYSDLNVCPKFLIGFDRAKQRFYDLEEPTRGLTAPVVEKSVADNTTFGEKFNKERDYGSINF
jgi:replicative DNA helicase